MGWGISNEFPPEDEPRPVPDASPVGAKPPDFAALLSGVKAALPSKKAVQALTFPEGSPALPDDLDSHVAAQFASMMDGLLHSRPEHAASIHREIEWARIKLREAFFDKTLPAALLQLLNVLDTARKTANGED